MLMPGERLGLAALFALGVAALVYPLAFRRLLHWRWALFLGFLLVPNLLWVGVHDSVWLGIPVSVEGLENGWRMVLRAVIVVLAVDGFTASVSVSEITALFERAGLKGLGFALGVAVNLLSALRESVTHTWHSLWLRGGFRQQRFQALRLLFMTVVAGALRRVEEISLAAEARAFSPDQARSLPLKAGRGDPILAACLLVMTVLILVWA